MATTQAGQAPRVPWTKRLGAAVVAVLDFFWLRSWWHVCRGLLVYWWTGKTPESGRRSMVELFCKSNGRTNDFFHFWVRRLNPPLDLKETSGVLGDLGPRELAAVAEELRDTGYKLFPAAVPAELCDRLTRLALRVRCTPWYFPPPQPEPAPYDRSNIIAPTYWAVEDELVNDPAYQQLMADPSLAAVSQAYLQTAPLLGICAMWWSTVFKKEACDPSAQRFHFDCARTKWLKVFFYLTDVTTATGPHCFVAHSHRPSRSTAKLLKYGHNRLADELIEQNFPAADVREHTGPRGTIILEDSRGFHKAKVPLAGERLMMELEYCNSLFGATYPRPTVRLRHGSPLAEMMARYPRIYHRFVPVLQPATEQRAAA